jgi:hypothetical protein
MIVSVPQTVPGVLSNTSGEWNAENSHSRVHPRAQPVVQFRVLTANYEHLALTTPMGILL